MQLQTYVNPYTRPVAPSAGFNLETRIPMRAHQSLPGYKPTPLLESPELAAALGVATVLLKDESSRMDLPSFKILGASWAVLAAVCEAWLGVDALPLSISDVAAELAAGPAGRRLVAATDGNHGRSVARMARLLGLESVVLVPSGTAEARVDAIADEGAEVDVVEGTYDDAVMTSAALADERTLVVSDTSWPGYERVPRAVIEGYSTMFFEIDDQIAAQQLREPTLVAVQAGVGAFAASALRHYRSTATGVRTAVVEPLTANCLMASAKAGHPTEVRGPHPSHMVGLNCGRPSAVAWPIVAAATDTFIAIDDVAAFAAMRLLATVGVESGESGAAALAGLLALAEDVSEARGAGLDAEACVLVVNTEAATDPVSYQAVLAAALLPFPL